VATPIKRLNYFDQQFLRVGDFRAEQDFHRRMLREHNRTLHTVGVASGLTVAPAGTAVTVSSGVAVDADGEEIVLVDAQTLDLADQPAGQPVYVTIAYRALATDPDTGTSNATRHTDSPLIAKSLSAPADPDRTLILGLAQRSGTTVTSVAPGGRKRSGETVAGPLSIQGALSANAGATANGLSLGRDPGTGVDYPWEYETVGVTQPNFNLRLQSPNAVVVPAAARNARCSTPAGWRSRPRRRASSSSSSAQAATAA
jgi:hypothetical protein